MLYYSGLDFEQYIFKLSFFFHKKPKRVSRFNRRDIQTNESAGEYPRICTFKHFEDMSGI